MQIEIVILLLGAAVTSLGYIAKTLHNMDRNLAVAVSKIESHDIRLTDHERRIRKIEANY